MGNSSFIRILCRFESKEETENDTEDIFFFRWQRCLLLTPDLLWREFSEAVWLAVWDFHC